MFEGQEIKEGTPSRRDFLLGIVVTSAVALPMFSPPARAAVSMYFQVQEVCSSASSSITISDGRGVRDNFRAIAAPHAVELNDNWSGGRQCKAVVESPKPSEQQ